MAKLVAIGDSITQGFRSLTISDVVSFIIIDPELEALAQTGIDVRRERPRRCERLHRTHIPHVQVIEKAIVEGRSGAPRGEEKVSYAALCHS